MPGGCAVCKCGPGHSADGDRSISGIALPQVLLVQRKRPSQIGSPVSEIRDRAGHGKLVGRCYGSVCVVKDRRQSGISLKCPVDNVGWISDVVKFAREDIVSRRRIEAMSSR